MTNNRNNAESQIYGQEVDWNLKLEDQNAIDNHLCRAMNWYNYAATDSQRRDWTLEYMKSCDTTYTPENIKKVQSLPETSFKIVYGETDWCVGFDIGMVARLKSLKAPIPQIWNENLDKAILYLISKKQAAEPVSGAKESPKRDVQKAVAESTKNLLGCLEETLDSILAGKITPSTENITKDIKPIYLPKIRDHFTPIEKELNAAVSNADVEIKDAYSIYKKAHLKNAIKYLVSLLSECQDRIAVEKATKKTITRTRKKKSPIDLVKNLQFKKEDTDLKLVSVLPSTIIGAKYLVTFNTKTRFLTIFEADSSYGLSVKGTSVIQYDEKKSKMRMLRKPEKFFADIKSGGIRVIKSTFNSLTTTDKEPSPRINADTILYGVF